MLPVEEPIVEEIEEEPIVEEVDTADIVDSEGTRSAPSPREITIEPFSTPEFDVDHDFEVKNGCFQSLFPRFRVISMATILQAIFIFFDEVFNTVCGTTYLMRDDGATDVNRECATLKCKVFLPKPYGPFNPALYSLAFTRRHPPPGVEESLKTRQTTHKLA